ncbi:ring oxydation complex/ phenylacetic acid degradation, partial [Candidatus Acidianus copahuensis]
MISPLSNEAKSTLLDILSLRADMELAMVEMYSPWLVNAPTVDGRLFVAKLVSDELNHAWQLSRIIQEFKPEGEKIVDELRNLRLGLHKLEAFNLPLFNWDDVLAFTFLIDKAGIYMLEALRNYEPLSKVVENMIKEEELHVT